MSRIIKDFDSFSNNPVNEDFSLGKLGDIFGGLLNFAGEGLKRTIKQKVAAGLMEKLGIAENSTLSVLIQEVIEKIELKDYPDLLTGEKANVEYFAPLMAKAIQEFIQRKGIDTLASELGIKPNGWLYSTIREGLLSEKGKAAIESTLVSAFGGRDASGSIARDAISNLDQKDKLKISDALGKKIKEIHGESTSPDMTSGKSKGFGDYISSFLSALTTSQS